ncbi:MAG: hypothetical protein MK100_05490, partial [Phycisphaerales bacterium]|nr:hypothetical protein [Phycisphaerales bacterium]
MPTATRRKAPHLFHHRLRLLTAAFGVVLLLLLTQAIRLTIIQGDAHRLTAESRLRSVRWLPTWRGTIFDREGRVLARDEPRWEIAVAYDAITGQWADDHAVRDARDAMGRDAWNMASPEVRVAAIEEARPPWDAVLESVWKTIARGADMDRDALELELNAIRARVQRMAAVVWDQQRRRHDALHGQGGGPRFTPRPIREQVAAHIVVPSVSDAPAASIEAFAADHPDLVEVRYARHRSHPQDNIVVEIDRMTLPSPLRNGGRLLVSVPRVAGDIVGDIRSEVWEEDASRRPFHLKDGEVDRGGYREEDQVGARGIERAWEDVLRGEVGLLVRDHAKGDVSREEPVGGADIQLTLDTGLQARVEAVLQPFVGLTVVQPWHGNTPLPVGTPLAASVVVLEINSGEILTMASTPSSFNSDRLKDSQAEAMQPWLLRPVEVAAPPGSIVKPLVMAAAVGAGVLEPGERIECKGHHFEDQPDMARCWIYRPRYDMATHGELGPIEALARSCNCWFYELGERMGLERLSGWLGDMGLGHQPDVGLSPSWGSSPVENAGLRPEQEDFEILRERGEATFEAVMLSIGQGRTTWTPLHAADAYATLVRHGLRMAPTLVRGWSSPDVPVSRELDPSTVATAIAGLEDVVEMSYGSANHLPLPSGNEPIFNIDGIKLAAKTGTAQAPPWRHDINGDGVIEADERLSGVEHA